VETLEISLNIEVFHKVACSRCDVPPDLFSTDYVKHLSVQIFHTDQDDMLEDLEQGDVAETVRAFFEKSQHLHPAKKSTLCLQDVSVCL
jgi:hypothetical protein